MSDDFNRFHRLDGEGGASELDRRQLEKQTADEPLWLRCDLRDRANQAWLQDKAGIPEFAVDTLLAESTRPRFSATDNGLLLVLRGVNMNPGAESDDMIAVRIWLDRNRIITCQRRYLRSIEDVADQLQQQHGPRWASDVLVGLVERLAEYIEDVLDKLSDELEMLEDSVENNPDLTYRTGLSLLRRKAARIRRFLNPQREALDRLCRNADPWLAKDQVEDVQQSLDALVRHLEDLDLVRERAVLIQEELQNRIAEEQNSRIYVLSIVTAIFLPLTFITGLFGMNVAGLPGLEDPSSFFYVCMLSAVLAVGLGVWLRFKKWF
ncbi:MAG: zinc transporter ZntB [Xanthomonadales bacterium]|nr:zinc transporter ZntB [Xanthomonadales bacterium]